MRICSIVALCLFAASANAAIIDDIRTCVQNELKTKIQQLREDVDGRLKSIAESGNEAAAKAREEFKVKTEEFQKAITEPLDQARSKYQECVNNANGLPGRARCVRNFRTELNNNVIPTASEKASELATAINNIATQFRDDNQGNFEDLRNQGREFAESFAATLRNCATQ